jgi:hypothetical protein
MDRIMFGDLRETTALLFGELAGERDRHVDLLGAFGLRTHESDPYQAKRPLLALGVQAHGHALARPQRGEHELGRLGPSSAPPETAGSSAVSRCGPMATVCT